MKATSNNSDHPTFVSSFVVTVSNCSLDSQKN